MKKTSIIKDKSFAFAVEIVLAYRKLTEMKKEFVLSKQMLRSGTSIGANVREAYNGESTADFIHKLGIAQKETDETLYWLELLNLTHYIDQHEFNTLQSSAEEIPKIMKSIILTSRQNLKK